MGLDVSKANRSRLVGLALDRGLAEAGWKLASVSADGIADTVFHPGLNRNLADGRGMRMSFVDDSFQASIRGLAHARVEELRAQGKIVFDAPKLRMMSEPTESVALGKTTYFNGVVTNDFCLKDFSPEGGNRTDGTSIAFPGGIIPPLQRSLMSNHVGAAALGVDGNGVMMFCIAGAASAVSASKISPAAAGSCDVEDFAGRSDFIEAVSTALTRELREEVGIVADAHVETRILGFIRDLERGGKPEFVGIARVAAGWEQCREELSVDEKNFTDGHISIDCRKLGQEGTCMWFEANRDKLAYATRTTFMAFSVEMSREGSSLPEWLGLERWY